MIATAIVLAAGRGRRMGQDKALLELGGRTAVERVVHACRAGGCQSVVVVRGAGDAPLPEPVRGAATVVEIDTGGEMIDSVRTGLRHRAADAEVALVFPVDYALVDETVVAAVLASYRQSGAGIALPLWEERPGHPIALSVELESEAFDPNTTSLRDVVVRDSTRVCAVGVGTPWVRRDLDTPADLAAARDWLERPETQPNREE